MASALPEDGRVTCCDISEEWTAIGRRYWEEAGVAGRIDLRIAPAADTLQSLLDAGRAGTYDFAFIDADKANHSLYYERTLELLRPGGVAAVDNVLWGGSVVDAQADDEDTCAIRAFNAARHADERVDISLVPIGDGLTLARKR